MKRTLTLLSLVAGVPVFGWLVGWYVHSTMEDLLRKAVVRDLGARAEQVITAGLVSLESLCASADPAMAGACALHDHNVLLMQASVWALLAGLALLAAIKAAALAAGHDRRLLVAFFAPGIRLLLAILFVLVLVHGAVGTYALYVLEAVAIGRIHFGIIAGIGLGALWGAYVMVRAGLLAGRPVSATVVGRRLAPPEQGRLADFIRALAGRIGARIPDNIVVGFEPTFYATCAEVTTIPGKQVNRGQTLYVSLPMLRMLSETEFAAVAGHELGHFAGEDADFSIRFYPIYAGAISALVTLQAGATSASQKVALLPAVAGLSFFIDQFATAERSIGRERELAADRAGASVSSPEDIARSLLKIAAFAPEWARVARSAIDAIEEDAAPANLSTLFVSAAAAGDSQSNLDAALEMQLPHPTDTHPPIRQRIEALNRSPAVFLQEKLDTNPARPAISLLDGAEELEESLSADLKGLPRPDRRILLGSA